MPLNAGEPGYGSVAASVSPGGLAGSMGGSETVPLLIPDSEPEPVPWHPMSKEELELAAGGPGWRKVRSRLVWLFWVLWLAMLATAVAIVVQSPRPVPTPLQWWQKSLFYQLRPAMFTEDAQRPEGISVVGEHLPYLKALGVGGLLLEGLFKKASPPDLTLVDEDVGTLPQLKQLLLESNKAGLRVLLDLCELDLFGPREANDTDEPPVPPQLAATVQYAVRYWLEQGVAGFAICDTDAAYSQQTLLEWRVVIKEFSAEEERIVLVKQTGDALRSGSVNGSLVQVIVRSILPTADHLLSAQEVAVAVETHLKSVSKEIWPSWTVGGESSTDLRKLLLVLMMTLPGSPIVQYGEEISHIQNVSVNMDWRQEGEQSSGPSVSSADQAKAARASLALFNSLSHSRAKEEALLYGSFTFLPFNTTANSTLAPAPLLAFLRSWGCVHFLVLLNTGPHLHTLDPAWAPALPEAGVFVTSSGMDRLGSTTLGDLTLQPHEALVIKLFETGSYSP